MLYILLLPISPAIPEKMCILSTKIRQLAAAVYLLPGDHVEDACAGLPPAAAVDRGRGGHGAARAPALLLPPRQVTEAS